MLLKQGARVDIPAPLPEPDRPSPLDLAVLRGDPVLVRILLEHGANVNRSSPVIGSLQNKRYKSKCFIVQSSAK